MLCPFLRRSGLLLPLYPLGRQEELTATAQVMDVRGAECGCCAG